MIVLYCTHLFQLILTTHCTFLVSASCWPHVTKKHTIRLFLWYPHISYIFCVFSNFFGVFRASLLWTSLLWVMGEGLGLWLLALVTVDMLQVTCYRWHMTCDTWHVTHDKWHVTHDTWHMTNIFSYFFLIFSVYLVRFDIGATIRIGQEFSVSRLQDFFFFNKTTVTWLLWIYESIVPPKTDFLHPISINTIISTK